MCLQEFAAESALWGTKALAKPMALAKPGGSAGGGGFEQSISDGVAEADRGW